MGNDFSTLADGANAAERLEVIVSYKTKVEDDYLNYGIRIETTAWFGPVKVAAVVTRVDKGLSLALPLGYDLVKETARDHRVELRRHLTKN